MSSNPSAVTSTASCSCATSYSSLRRRSSDTKRVRSASSSTTRSSSDASNVVDVRGRDAEVGGDPLQRGARADPELADRGVRVELRAWCGRRARGSTASRRGRPRRAARRRAPSRAPSRRPSRSGARTPSARGTGSRCRCCALGTGPAGMIEPLARERRRDRVAAARRVRRPAREPAGGSRAARPIRSRSCSRKPWPNGLTPIHRAVRGISVALGCEFGRAGRFAVACGAHPSSLARRRSAATEVSRPVRTARSADGGRCPSRPSTAARASRSASSGSRPSRDRSARRAAPGISADQVPTPPLPVSAAPSWQRPSVPPSTPRLLMWSIVALKSPAMITFVVDALVREPLQVVAPVLHVALARCDRVRGHHDRPVAGGRHRDGARHGRGVARAVQRGLDHGVVAEFRRDQQRRRAAHPTPSVP